MFKKPQEQNCAALLAFVSLLWCTEALPLYITSTLIPLLAGLPLYIMSTLMPLLPLSTYPIALFNPETSISTDMSCHPYTGNLNSETPGDGENALLLWRNV